MKKMKKGKERRKKEKTIERPKEGIEASKQISRKKQAERMIEHRNKEGKKERLK